MLPLIADVNSSHNIGTISLTPSTVDPIVPAISGLAKDTITNLPIENADVYDENVYGPFFTGKTKSDGSFSITLEESGTYNLKFIKDGYEDKDLPLVAVTGNTALDTISMQPNQTFEVGGIIADLRLTMYKYPSIMIISSPMKLNGKRDLIDWKEKICREIQKKANIPDLLADAMPAAETGRPRSHGERPP